MKSPTVYLVDDDASALRGLERLLRSAGYDVKACLSAQDTMDRQTPGLRSCLVADIVMPGINGLDLQRMMAEAGNPMPVIFVTAHDSARFREIAKKAGAAGYLQKPVDGPVLIEAIETALRRYEEAAIPEKPGLTPAGGDPA